MGFFFFYPAKVSNSDRKPLKNRIPRSEELPYGVERCLSYIAKMPRPQPSTDGFSVELGDATGASYSLLRTRQATKPVIVNLVQV